MRCEEVSAEAQKFEGDLSLNLPLLFSLFKSLATATSPMAKKKPTVPPPSTSSSSAAAGPSTGGDLFDGGQLPSFSSTSRESCLLYYSPLYCTDVYALLTIQNLYLNPHFLQKLQQSRKVQRRRGRRERRKMRKPEETKEMRVLARLT